jgi:hypothetical protein
LYRYVKTKEGVGLYRRQRNLPYVKDYSLDVQRDISTDNETQAQQSRIIPDSKETVPQKKQRVTQHLTDVFAKAGININVKYNPNLDANGEVAFDGNTATITLNQKRVFDDTIPHEFGHIYIDLLGTNPIVQEGINQLKDTPLWNAVKEAYPELNEEQLGKEVLVTAIGRKYEDKRLPKWKYWLNRFFRAVGKLFGVKPYVARQLAEDMMADELRKGSGVIEFGTNWQSKLIEDEEQAITKFINIAKNNKTKIIGDKYESDSRKATLNELQSKLTKLWESGDKDKMRSGVNLFADIAKKDIDKITSLWNEPTYFDNITAKELKLTYEVLRNYEILDDIYNFIAVDSRYDKGLKDAIQQIG